MTNLKDIPPTKTKNTPNLADPDSASRWWKLPIDEIGLARMEFTVTEQVRAHPMALAHPKKVTDPDLRKQIIDLTIHFASLANYFILRRCGEEMDYLQQWLIQSLFL